MCARNVQIKAAHDEYKRLADAQMLQVFKEMMTAMEGIDKAISQQLNAARV
jgi:hypothetical protein